MATTRRATRYPVLPRKPKPKAGYSQQLADEAAKVYAEIVDGEAIVTYRWPGWQDAKKVLEVALASMARVAQQEEDRETAMKAAAWLAEYARREMERLGQGANHGAQVMAQLEALYAKALPERAEPLVEVVEEERKERG